MQVGDHADHGEPRIRRLFTADLEAPAERVHAGPPGRCSAFGDQRHRLGVGTVVRGEVATLDQMQADGADEAGQHAGDAKRSGVGGEPRLASFDGCVGIAEWYQQVRRRGEPDGRVAKAWHRGKPLFDVARGKEQFGDRALAPVSRL